MRKTPLIIAVALVIIGSAAIALAIGGKSSSSGGATTTAVPVATLNCIGGSEKQVLMEDPQLQSILLSRYHLRVNFQPRGSYEQVQLTTAQLKAEHVDCLWPSSDSAQKVFEATHSLSAFPDYKAATLLESPEVLYSGPQSTAALLRAGIVQERANRYFIVNMKQLLLDLVLKSRTWASLGAQNIGRPITIFSTDPATSNSGFTLAQLELIVLSTDNPYQDPTLAQAQAHLPIVRALYNAQGLQASSSAAGFQQWLLQGGEQYAPLYAGYESQIIAEAAQSTANPTVTQELKQQVRILYPQPTIYADHPLLALNANAGRLITALEDPQIQDLAWRKYGFRSGVQLGSDQVADFPNLPLATTVQTTIPPSADVTLALLGCIQNNKC